MKESMLITLLVTLTTPSWANTTRRYSGASCLADRGSASAIVRLDTCIQNSDSAAYRGVMCPAFNQSDSISDLENIVYYEDGSTVESLSCYWQAQTFGGTTYTSATRYSCSTAGGCSSASASYNGSGYLDFTSGTSSLLNSGSAMSYVISWGAICTLPAYYNTWSRINGYATITDLP